MKRLVLVLLLALGLAGLRTPAAGAFPTIEVAACDTLGVDPLRVRTTFDLASVYGAGYVGFVLHPWPPRFERGPEDSTNFFACEAPPGWTCTQDDRVPYLDFLADDYGWRGDPFPGFSIVSNRAAPCVLFIFWNVVIGDEYTIQTCLTCDAPVPASPSSWGRLKSVYR